MFEFFRLPIGLRLVKLTWNAAAIIGIIITLKWLDDHLVWYASAIAVLAWGAILIIVSMIEGRQSRKWVMRRQTAEIEAIRQEMTRKLATASGDPWALQ